MDKKTKWILIGGSVTAGILALAGTASYFITKKMIEVALNREAPKAIGKSREIITGNENIEETLKFQSEIAKKLEGLNLETIEITASDGTLLIGHLHRAQNAKRTIIAMHGWRSSWAKDFCLVADFWFSNDCNVLFAEQRAHGESGGNHMGFGVIERFDCLDWINWAKNSEFQSTPLYLAGISMGATTVLMTAGFDIKGQVNGIMADCGFTSPHDIWKHIANNNIHIGYSGFYSSIVNDYCKKKMNFSPKEYSTIEAMENCEVPVLFFHGTDDNFVPIDMTFQNYKACKAPKKLFIVPGAEHGMSYVLEKEEYEKNVVEFWANYDNI
jgi:alpha-beta hydrolase superfamily lysophospholipase